MKRGIPIALQAAGAVLACLVTSLNHPVIAIEPTVSMRDTVHYYNKHGREIFRNTKSDTAGYYIIRTCKMHRQLFDDWYDRDTSKESGEYMPASVCRIKGSEARKTRRRIRRGLITDSIVQLCIVPMPDKMLIKKMLDSIKVGIKKDEKDYDFREYGGVINRDASLICQHGDSTNPRSLENEGLILGIGERGNFHSHPEGEIEIKDSIARYDPNHVLMSVHYKTVTYKFVQGPSCRDQQFIKDKTGYVFGMRSKLVYLYNKDGVCATLPFKSLTPKRVNK